MRMLAGRRAAGAATVALALALAGCCAPATQDAARTEQVPPTPEATGTPTSTAEVATTTATASATVLKVYFDREEKMQAVQRRVPATKAVLASSIEALLAGPSAAERAAGLETLIPKGTRLRSVRLSSGIATVDLSGAFDDGGGTLSMTNRLAQVVFTLTQFPGVKGVRFRLDGKPVTAFGGEGLDLSEPQTRAGYEYATPAILVDDPAWGATVSSPIALRGTADVFEAVFQLEVVDPNGAVKATRTVTATAGTGTRGTWTAVVPFSLGASGEGRLRVFTLSAKDGVTRENVSEVRVLMTH